MKEFKLDNHPKISAGFSVPENYFENFSAKLLQKLPENEPKVVSFYQKKKKLLFAAAAIFVLALTIPMYTSLFLSNQEIDNESIENYLAYQQNITQYELINELENQDLLSLNLSAPVDNKIIEELLLKDENLEQLILE